MTIVGSKRMIVYDDVAQQEKFVLDARVERAHRTTTLLPSSIIKHGHGDTYAPYITGRAVESNASTSLTAFNTENSR